MKELKFEKDTIRSMGVMNKSMLKTMSGIVLQLSEEFNIAILLTNQVISDPSGELIVLQDIN